MIDENDKNLKLNYADWIFFTIAFLTIPIILEISLSRATFLNEVILEHLKEMIDNYVNGKSLICESTEELSGLEMQLKVLLSEYQELFNKINNEYSRLPMLLNSDPELLDVKHKVKELIKKD